MVAGDIAPGDLVQVAYLFTILAFPVRAIGWVLGELPRSVVGWDRVSRVLDATGGLTYGTAELDAEGPAVLGVQGVRFAYDDTEVLHDVTFTVEAGRTVAVVGPTGSGKSTLTTLLVRLVDPATGEVLLDGVDLRAVARGGVAGAAAVVPQQTFLFDDTVRGNVTLGLDLTDEAVLAALRVAQADRFVDALPDGLDTRIGERGMTLSGGQRQRLALARAVVREPAAARDGRRHLSGGPAGGAGDPGRAARPGARAHGRRSSWSPTARRRSRSPTRWSTSRTAGCSTAARTTSCSPGRPATGG